MTAATEMRPDARPPSPLLMLAEGRAVLELASFYAMRPMLRTLPTGDGHPVLVLPGFMASNSSTKPMRALLTDLGYDVHGWELGRNVKIDSNRVAAMADQLKRLFVSSGRKVSIVGWSLGGVFARELAKMHPEAVRGVITLGSPISDDRNHTNARRLFEMLNGKEPEPMKQGQFTGLGNAPPVPTTSVLTKSDGIVHWRGSVQEPGSGQTENIQVCASHVGLGVNPSVMVAVADRLSQAEGAWTPFVAPLVHKWMFPKTAVH